MPLLELKGCSFRTCDTGSAISQGHGDLGQLSRVSSDTVAIADQLFHGILHGRIPPIGHDQFHMNSLVISNDDEAPD
jgi:hypothetical protein